MVGFAVSLWACSQQNPEEERVGEITADAQSDLTSLSPSICERFRAKNEDTLAELKLLEADLKSLIGRIYTGRDQQPSNETLEAIARATSLQTVILELHEKRTAHLIEHLIEHVSESLPETDKTKLMQCVITRATTSGSAIVGSEPQTGAASSEDTDSGTQNPEAR